MACYLLGTSQFHRVFVLVRAPSEQSAKKLIIIPRHNSTEQFFQRASEKYSSQEWDEVAIVSLDPRHDQPSIDRLKHTMPDSQYRRTVFIRTIDELVEALHDASFVLSQRYHGAIGALALGVPFDTAPQVSGDKLDVLMRMDRSACAALVDNGKQTLDRVLKR